eukprot:gnl/MRDRNA2_/MRDRNA2_85170_c0_seq1.p1 gnl/MRDRNA2_/MRDRNA2_85170_c0~~gnl/MRDRNA2_/MRDRNA2_85170_c0_seq1.p1  ORF type:complete len:497 (+),score=70.06 gnl/MRDRNA2_/MRDRNA2_85170_c0_seq1:116-1606(+)
MMHGDSSSDINNDDADSKVRKGVNLLDYMSNKRSCQSSLGTYMRSEMLRSISLFQGCDPNFVSKIIEDVDIAFFKPGDIVLQQGDEANSCYILNRGEVAVIVDGEQVAKLGDGSIFGEICLLGLSQRRTASIQALEVCDVRVVHQSKFRFALKGFPEERARFRKEAQKRMAELARNEEQKNPKPKEAAKLHDGCMIRRASKESTNAPSRHSASKESTDAPVTRTASKESNGRRASQERAGQSASRRGSRVNPETIRGASKESADNSYHKFVAARRIGSRERPTTPKRLSPPRPPMSPERPPSSPIPGQEVFSLPPVTSPAPRVEFTAMESNENGDVMNTSKGGYHDIAARKNSLDAPPTLSKSQKPNGVDEGIPFGRCCSDDPLMLSPRPPVEQLCRPPLQPINRSVSKESADKCSPYGIPCFNEDVPLGRRRSTPPTHMFTPRLPVEQPRRRIRVSPLDTRSASQDSNDKGVGDRPYDWRIAKLMGLVSGDGVES